MKNLFYILFLLPFYSVSILGQCTTPLSVNIIANQTGDCTYEVLIGMNPPLSTAQIQNFDITALFGGVNSGIVTECHFPPQSSVFCNTVGSAISLFSVNSGSSDLFQGFTLVEFETDGCLTFDANGFFASDPCIVLGNVSGFCTTPPQPSGLACVDFNYLDDPRCETDVFTSITAVSGCSSQTSGVPPGQGVCFNTYDNECVEIEMDEGACGCEDENVISTLDLLEIQWHILGLDPLSATFPIAIADVNCDGDITAIDLLEIRKHILGLPSGVEGDCPGIGECVMVDNTTGEVVTEICPFEQLDVSLGVFGDANGSCDPCGNGVYNAQDDPSIGSFLAVTKEGESSFLTFEEDIVFHSIILELPLDYGIETSQVHLSSRLNVDNFEKNIVGNKLHVLLFSHVPVAVKQGDILLEIEEKDLNIVGKLDTKKNFILNSDGGLLAQNRISNSKFNSTTPSFEHTINNSQLILSHNLSGDNISVRIVNVNGQVLYEKNLTNNDGFINIDTPINENLFFVSILSETETVTKPILNIN